MVLRESNRVRPRKNNIVTDDRRRSINVGGERFLISSLHAGNKDVQLMSVVASQG